jgi:hypothetical protein
MSKAQGIANSANQGQFRNRIINGDCRIDQRNAGAAVTLTSVGAYTVDRWIGFEDTDGSMTAQQSSVAPAGFTNSLLITTTSADASLGATQFSLLAQRIEGFNIADLEWGTANAQPVTLSFWVRSSLTGTFGGSFGNGSFNRYYAFSYTINSANTWEQKSITVAGDTTGTWATNNGIGIQVNFGLGVGSTYSGTAGSWGSSALFSTTGATSVIGTLNATWHVTGVQLEKGSTATSFDYRPYGTEESLCKRYYQQYTQPALRGVVSGGAALGRVGMTLPVTMRAAPTATAGALPVFDGGVTGTVTGILTAYNTVNVVEFDFATTNPPFTVGRAAVIYQAGSSTLTLSAEL